MRAAKAIVGLAGSAVVVTLMAAQAPAPSGVIVARTADDAGAVGDTDDRAAELGFVVGEEHVIANVGASATDFIVSDAGGAEHGAQLVAHDAESGLGLLFVPGLSAVPYPFARDAAHAQQAVHGATRDGDSGVVALVLGHVQGVQPGAAGTDPGSVRHDAFNDWQRNFGAPLLNSCGEIVGAVIDDHDPNLASAGSGLAVPGEWLLERFSADGLTATPVETDCLSQAERVAAAEAEAAEAAERAAAAEAEAVEAAERAAAAEAEAVEAAERAAAAETEADAAAERATAAEVEATEATQRVAAAEQLATQAQQAAEAAAEAQERAQAAAAEAEQRAAAQRARYVRWGAVAGVAAPAVALLFWFFGRRYVTKSKREKLAAENAAQAAESELAEREERDRAASAVPAVFLDGADAEGRTIALSIPGSAIVGQGGAVVGRNPFDSTVVLDHVEVSRRHFRLSVHGTSILVEDLHSMNGTMLDDAPLTPGVAEPLRSGAVLRIGGLTLTVTLQQ